MDTGRASVGSDGAGAAPDGDPEAVVRRWSVCVAEFHKRFGFHQTTYTDMPDEIRWRMKLTKEEAWELYEAVEEEDAGPEAVIREAVDVVYIALGTLWTYGIPVGVSANPFFELGSTPHYLAVTVSKRLVSAMESDDRNGIGLCAGVLIQLCEAIVRKIDPRLRLDMFFDEVHRANMEKRPGVLDRRPLKEGGWRPPDIGAILRALRRVT